MNYITKTNVNGYQNVFFNLKKKSYIKRKNKYSLYITKFILFFKNIDSIKLKLLIQQYY